MRQGNTLVIIIALLIAAAVAAGAYLYFSQQSTTPPVANPDQLATPIPEPEVAILEAASDIPANKLITSADRETLFQPRTVKQSEVVPGDVQADQFDTFIEGRVTVTAIQGGNRIRRSLFRKAGIAEIIPTAPAGEESRKAMTVLVTDLGDIAAINNRVDVVGSFFITQPYLRFTSQDQTGVIALTDADYSDVSTKVLGQNIPVLDVIPPPIPIDQQEQNAQQQQPVAPEGEEVTATPEGEVATPRPSFGQGSVWTVVLAVTDQEAELIQYTKDKNGVLGLIVRRNDDNELVATTGVTLDLLTRLYGVAQAYPQPNILVDLVKGQTPPFPPGQPAVVIPIPPPFSPVQGPAPAQPTATVTP